MRPGRAESHGKWAESPRVWEGAGKAPSPAGRASRNSRRHTAAGRENLRLSREGGAWGVPAPPSGELSLPTSLYPRYPDGPQQTVLQLEQELSRLLQGLWGHFAPQHCPLVLVPWQLLSSEEPGQSWHPRKWEWGARRVASRSAQPTLFVRPLGSSGSE